MNQEDARLIEWLGQQDAYDATLIGRIERVVYNLLDTISDEVAIAFDRDLRRQLGWPWQRWGGGE